MIEIVRAYKTTDGAIHNTQLDAEMAQYKIDVQSFFNTHTVVFGRTGPNEFTPKRVAEVIDTDPEAFIALIRNHRRTVTRLTNSAKDKAQLTPA